MACPLEGKPKLRGVIVPSCTHWSDVPSSKQSGSLPTREAAHMEWREFPGCASWSDSPNNTKCGPQLQMFLGSKQPHAMDGRRLMGTVPPRSPEQNGLRQLLGAQARGCPRPGLTCHGHGLLAGSPKLLTICLAHSETKQTETLEFGIEKVLLQGHARRWVAHALKAPNSPEGFGKALLKAR